MEQNKSSLALVFGILAAAAIIGALAYGVLHLSASTSGRGGTSNADAISLDSSLTTGTSVTIGTSLTQNSVTSQNVRSALVAATTTPCNIQNPLSATSTYTFGLNVTTGTSTFGLFVVATSTRMNATTTVLDYIPVPASSQISAIFDGVATTGVNQQIGSVVGPLGWVTMGSVATTASGVATGLYTLGGTCQATFQSLSN